ncbi:hypothetical protein LCGC14_2875570, partial [marine sediment metagenome]
ASSPVNAVATVSGGPTYAQASGASSVKSGSLVTEIFRGFTTSALSNQTITITTDEDQDAVAIVISFTSTKATSGDPDLGIGTVSVANGRGNHSASVAETAAGFMAAMVGYETEASGHTPGSGYTEDAQVTTVAWSSGAWETKDAEHDGTGNTTVDGTFSGTTDFAVIRVEILSAAAASTVVRDMIGTGIIPFAR